MFKYGLKLWSNNINYINDAIKYYEKNVYEYIELFSLPGTYDKYINYWNKLNIPYVIHAPHYKCGLNLSDKSNINKNQILAKEALKYADALNAEIIIFHPGINGELNQTIQQLNQINDTRIVIENMPYYALANVGICLGSSVEEIRLIKEHTGVGFCLDIGHAVYAANATKIDKLEMIKKFIDLKPKLFHLSDGKYEGIYDEHLNFGQGNFKLEDILVCLKADSMITIETNKNFDNKLTDFFEDIKYLNELF